MMSPTRSLFLNEQFSDVAVKVRSSDGYTWRFPAHSLILKNGSEWFREAIEEQSLISTDDIAITFIDVSQEVVLCLLRFLYTEELVPLRSEESLLELLSLAIRCRVWPLELDCEAKLLQLLRVGNACHLLKLATNHLNLGYGSTRIVQACQKIIQDYGQVVFSSELVFGLCGWNMEHILQSDYLNVVEEDVIFSGLWLWGKRKCCRRGLALTDENIVDQLEGLLQHIRFSYIKNSTRIPGIVFDRFCKCTIKTSKRSCCCLKEQSQSKGRVEYRPPRDLLRQSTRFLLFENLKPWHQESASDRILCAQISFDEDTFLVAAEIATIITQELPLDIFFSVVAEDTGLEQCREEVHWEEVEDKKDKKTDYVASSVIRFSYPIPIPRKVIHSLHLVLRTTESADQLAFPSNAVLRRRNFITSKDGPLTITLHADRVLAITAIHFIMAGHHLEK